MSHPFPGDPAQKLIPLLEHVRELRPGQWRAKCPGHDGKSQDSLSIAQGGDGTLLLRCWASCTAEEIVRSVGLELRDLFHTNNLSRAERRDYAVKAEHKKIRQALQHELLVLQQCNDAHIEGWPVIDPDPEARERQAVTRIRYGLEVLYGQL